MPIHASAFARLLPFVALAFATLPLAGGAAEAFGVTAMLAFWQAGEAIDVPEDARGPVIVELDLCMAYVTEAVRTPIDATDVEAIRQAEAAWFYEFEPYGSLELPSGRTLEVRRIVVPLSGRFATRSDAPVVTVLAEAADGGWSAWRCALDGGAIRDRRPASP